MEKNAGGQEVRTYNLKEQKINQSLMGRTSEKHQYEKQKPTRNKTSRALWDFWAGFLVGG